MHKYLWFLNIKWVAWDDLSVHAKVQNLFFSSRMKSTPALQPCSEGDWESTSSYGCWSVGSTAGGGRNFPTHGCNPCIPLAVTYDPGGNNVRVTLRQNRPEDALHAIGFHIYQVRIYIYIWFLSRNFQPIVLYEKHRLISNLRKVLKLPQKHINFLKATVLKDKA